MELYIFNTNRELVGIVESFEYLRWTRRYSQCGSFELKAIATQENAELLKEGNIIWKNDDEEAGIIEHLSLSQTDQEFITVSGRFATSFLARRIVWQTEKLSGDISDCVEQLIENNLINPSDVARKISGISFSSPSLDIPISTQISYRNLMDAVTELCEVSEVGRWWLEKRCSGGETRGERRRDRPRVLQQKRRRDRPRVLRAEQT
jgi:hypothetical protein